MNVRSVQWMVWLSVVVVLGWMTAAACGGADGTTAATASAFQAGSSPASSAAAGAGVTMLPVAGMQTLVKASDGRGGTWRGTVQGLVSAAGTERYSYVSGGGGDRSAAIA